MSDNTVDNRYNLDNLGTGRMSTQSMSMLPKSRPVRLKALLHESDEDDDDENEELCKSKSESDSEELSFLSQDDVENIQEESFLHKANINSSTESADKSSKPTSLSPKESCEIVTNISMHNEMNCANDKEECKVDSANFKSHLLIDDPIKPEACSCEHEGKTQGCPHNATYPLNHQTEDHNSSIDVALPPPSLSIYKGDYNVKSDANRNLQSINSAHNENAYILNKRKEEYMCNTPVENKVQLPRSGEYISNLSKEDSRYKGGHSFTEQASKDCEEKSYTILNSESEAASCVSQTSGNPMHSASYNSQYSSMKYEANEKYTPAKSMEYSTPSLTERGKTMINHLVSETPLKHLQPAKHPNPSMSHKQLFQTPQSKSSNDPSMNLVQTPSTILSSWNSNMRHMPMEGKSFIAKDHVQASRNIVYTPRINEKVGQRYLEVDVKNVRRPLTDTTLAHVGESLAYPLESRSFPLHTRFEAKSAAFESQQEDRGKRTVGLPDVKPMQTEANYSSDLRPIDEAKENRQPNMADTLIKSSRKIVPLKNESEQVIIGSNVGLKVIQDTSRDREDNNSVASSAECKNTCESYPVRENQHEELREIVNKVGKVQLTVPSSIPVQRQSKTLLVKDREYLILGSLGRGMSGEVLRVQDVLSGELRAIKCVNLNKMDKESAQGCLDEILMLRKLQAPCIVTMFDYQIKNYMVYVVMEMGDTDFSRLLKSMSQEKQIPFTMILYYWTEMLTAVKHIHDNGVIHSDLKPGNFLLVRGRLKLIDFGIASNLNSDMTSVLKNNPVGTLNYISPEALMDIGGSADSPTHNVKYKISFKSDVWSLGCILYSLVYGYTPFHHIRSQWAKINAITNPKPNISFPVTTFSTNGGSQSSGYAPPVLIDVMRKCLQHDPKARPTVSQLLQVQYVPVTQAAVPLMLPADIPANILVKIKHALNEEEWRQLVQVLDTNRHYI